MSSKLFRKVLIILFVLLVLVFVVLLFFKKDGVRIPVGVSNTQDTVVLKLPFTKTVETSVSVPQPKTTSNSLEEATPVKVEIPVVSPEVRARLFAEKFGSWSNSTIDAHVADIEPLVTSDYFSILKTALYALEKRYPVDGGYYGVTTRVYNVHTQSLQETLGVARVLAQIQRSIEYVENGENKNSIENKDIYIELRKKGNIWLVSDTNWLQ